MTSRSRLFLFATAICLLLFGLARQYRNPADKVKTIGQTPISHDSARTPYCKWVFDTYEPSNYEAEWFKEVPGVQSKTANTPNICTAMQAPKHVAAAKAIVGRAINLTSIDKRIQWAELDPAATAPLVAADEYMSRMHYRRVCYDEQWQTFRPARGHGVQLIEPLFGMLRDPFDAWCGASKLTMDNYPDNDPEQSKNHIIPQGYAPYAFTTEDRNVQANEWHSHGIPPWHSALRPIADAEVGTAFQLPQNIFIDFGSSYFGKWNENTAAASGKWHYDTYHARGRKFDKYIAVELQKLDNNEAYNQLPADLVGIYALMNIGLTMGSDKLNALEMIKRVVQPEDFLVFKLDIDSAPIEEPIVQSLVDDPENASDLIDELMFEHHVNYWPLNQPWHIAPTSDRDGDLLTSYNLFRDLRRKGIRAHSWP